MNETTVEHRHEEAELRYRSELLDLIATISGRFVGAEPADIAGEADRALERIGEFAGADRAYVVRFSDDQSTLSSIHEWCAEGIEPAIERIQGVPAGNFPWAAERHLTGEVVDIPRVSGLPPEASAEREGFEKQGIQSALGVPLICAGKVLGFFGLDYVRSQKSWSSGVRSALQILGGVLANALERAAKPIRASAVVEGLVGRRHAVEALRESETRFREMADNIREVFWLFDWVAQKVIYVSPAYESIWGRSVEALYERYEEWAESIYPEDMEYAAESFAQIVETGGGETRQYRIVRPDGSVRWVSDRGFAIRNEEGTVVRIAGIAEDITDQKLAEEALAAERERLVVTLRSIGDGVIATDVRGRITFMNKVAEELTGYRHAEAVGKRVEEIFRIVREDTRQPCPNPVHEAVESETIVSLPGDVILVSRDGSEYHVADSGAAIRDRQDRVIGAVLVFRDTTEKRRMEEELLRTQKLESLGILAGGIAHDFNNFLTAILGNVSLAKVSIEAGHKMRRKLEEMEAASLRAKKLTHQLLTFAKGGEPVKRALALSTLLRQSVTFALRGSNVGSELDVPDDLWSVEADEAQLGQVIHNIVLNADQAMTEGGVLHVQADNLDVPPENELGLDAGRHVRLSFQDQGRGIPGDELQRVFDPYFTTKHKGSGLGLTVAYSIVKKHNGNISVSSEIGKGTEFLIYLPVAETAPRETVEAEPPQHAGQGRVLVMDDEAVIRDVAADMLGELGFDASVAPDGREAIEQFTEAKKSGKPFDLVILDLTVPGGMGGLKAMRELLALDPGAKAIVSSGYSDDPVLADYGEHGFQSALIKPYRLEELSGAIQAALDEPIG